MDIRKLAPEVSVSAQTAASDMAAMQAAGFRSIICNRPDGEAADKPNFEKSRRLRDVGTGLNLSSFSRSERACSS